jgi:MFS family permease
MSQRYLIVGVTAIAALWMYIDRVCISILADPMQVDLGLSDREKGQALGAFFFTYALFQIPVGALADRFGPRLVLSISIAAWSLVTAVTGLVSTFFALLAVRLLLGITEAGAYPAAAGLVKRWARPDERGLFSSVVALGGRIGGAFAPYLTGWLATALVGFGLAVWMHTAAGVNWRGVFVLYGFCGLAVATIFWLFVRDRPPESNVPALRKDPEANQAEEWHALPDAGAEDATVAAPVDTTSFARRLVLIAGTRGMWLFGGVQFANNVSWAFLITLMPTFLKDAGVPFEQRKIYQTGILLGGCVGMVIGGFVTDALYRSLGPRWGRSLPIAVMMSLGALMCMVLNAAPGLWVAITALALMALFQDLGIPSVWAYAQDVGGRNVGTALGWGNMWGNFGAALSPVLLTEVQIHGGWSAAFAVCAGAYVVSALCGLLLDASRPIDANDAV